MNKSLIRKPRFTRVEHKQAARDLKQIDSLIIALILKLRRSYPTHMFSDLNQVSKKIQSTRARLCKEMKKEFPGASDVDKIYYGNIEVVDNG